MFARKSVTEFIYFLFPKKTVKRSLRFLFEFCTPDDCIYRSPGKITMHAVYRNELGVDNTVKPVFKTTWEIGTTCELRTATAVPRPIQDIEEIDLRNKTTSESRTVFHSTLGVPNSKVPLYIHSFVVFSARKRKVWLSIGFIFSESYM